MKRKKYFISLYKFTEFKKTAELKYLGRKKGVSKLYTKTGITLRNDELDQTEIYTENF